METLLPWQPENCALTQFYVSILSPYYAYMLFGTKCVAGLPGLFGNHCNHKNKIVH